MVSTPRPGALAQSTSRLCLSPVERDDPEALAALADIWSDRRTWEHLPSGRPTDDRWLGAWIAHQARSLARAGLGWWLVRLATDLPPLAAGAVIGAGGCALLDGLDAWNLGYRLTPEAWGCGLATELARAGLAAAQEARPELPVTARVLERNPASWHVLERVGLRLAWSGADPAGTPHTAGLVRRIYADRPLGDDLLTDLIAVEQASRATTSL